MDYRDWMMFAATLGAGVLTALATVLAVYFTNKRTSENYEMQIGEMQRSQEQNVRIQLFEKRYELYSGLSALNQFTKLVFSKTVTNPTTGDILPPKKAFTQVLFDGQQFLFAGIYYENTRDYLFALNDILRKNIANSQNADNETTKRDNEQFRIHLNSKIQRITEITNHANNERVRFGAAKHICSNIDFDKLTSFADSFSNAVAVVSDQNIAKLEETHKAFEEANILAPIFARPIYQAASLFSPLVFPIHQAAFRTAPPARKHQQVAFCPVGF